MTKAENNPVGFSNEGLIGDCGKSSPQVWWTLRSEWIVVTRNREVRNGHKGRHPVEEV